MAGVELGEVLKRSSFKLSNFVLFLHGPFNMFYLWTNKALKTFVRLQQQVQLNIIELCKQREKKKGIFKTGDVKGQNNAGQLLAISDEGKLQFQLMRTLPHNETDGCTESPHMQESLFPNNNNNNKKKNQR